MREGSPCSSGEEVQVPPPRAAEVLALPGPGEGSQPYRGPTSLLPQEMMLWGLVTPAPEP